MGGRKPGRVLKRAWHRKMFLRKGKGSDDEEKKNPVKTRGLWREKRELCRKRDFGASKRGSYIQGVPGWEEISIRKIISDREDRRRSTATIRTQNLNTFEEKKDESRGICAGEGANFFVSGKSPVEGKEGAP